MIIEELCNEELALNDYLNITQGHDFLYLFCAFCKRKKGKVAGVDDVSASLRCSYREVEFYNSCLFSNLNQYEIDNSVKIVISA